MDFTLSDVTTEADFLAVLPLMRMLVEEENDPFAKSLSTDEALHSWKKAIAKGYTVYAARNPSGALLAVFGLTELHDPLAAKPSFRLNNFIVDPAFRNQGIGREIMRQIEAIGSNANGEFILLEVMPDNEKAIRFYTSTMGYEYCCNRMLKDLTR